jgi:hypothetical protein
VKEIINQAGQKTWKEKKIHPAFFETLLQISCPDKHHNTHINICGN